MKIQVVVQARDVAVGDEIHDIHNDKMLTVSHRTNEQRGDDERTAGMWFDRQTSKEYDWIPIDDTFEEEIYWPDLMLEPSTLMVVWRSV